MSNAPDRTATAKEDEEDPIVATYSVFVKPPLPPNKKLVVFNYMNKTAPDPSQLDQPGILGLRVKPETGMYEVDIPIDTSVNYDKSKGIAYGTALAKSKEEKKDGSLGLAGGFGVGAPAAPRGGGRGNANADEAPLPWDEAFRAGKVLETQTLSGGRKAGSENVRYMLGVVQGKNIHLTPASSVVALRPVAYHLDALTEQERRARQQGGPGGTGEAGAGDKSSGRAIHMTLKAAMDDGGGVTAETIGDRLRAVQKEPWKPMDYYHDESVASWAAYKENLLLRSGQQGTKPTDKGKGKAVAASDDMNDGGDDSGSPELAERVPHLKTGWEEDDLLRAMAGIGKQDKKPGEEAVALSESQAILAERFAAATSKAKGKAAAVPSPAVAEESPAPTSPVRKRGRPARGGAAAARGGRNAGGAGSSARNAMQLD